MYRNIRVSRCVSDQPDVRHWWHRNLTSNDRGQHAAFESYMRSQSKTFPEAELHQYKTDKLIYTGPRCKVSLQHKYVMLRQGDMGGRVGEWAVKGGKILGTASISLIGKFKLARFWKHIFGFWVTIILHFIKTQYAFKATRFESLRQQNAHWFLNKGSLHVAAKCTNPLQRTMGKQLMEMKPTVEFYLQQSMCLLSRWWMSSLQCHNVPLKNGLNNSDERYRHNQKQRQKTKINKFCVSPDLFHCNFWVHRKIYSTTMYIQQHRIWHGGQVTLQ
jgi:hypothetical protein